MVSGIDRPQRLRMRYTSGASDYLIKPCEVEVLAISSERALERRNLQINCQTIQGRSGKAEQRTRYSYGRARAPAKRRLCIAKRWPVSVNWWPVLLHELNNPAGLSTATWTCLETEQPMCGDLLTAYDKVPLPANLAPLVRGHSRDQLDDLTRIWIR